MFTMRVGNILPGERVTRRAVTLVGPLPFEDGEATFRFPLVVAPRYIPGAPLAGDRSAPGTRRTPTRCPDASRITPAGAAARLPQPGAAVASTSTSTRPGCRSARSAPACTRSPRRSGHVPIAPGRAGRPRLHPAAGRTGPASAGRAGACTARRRRAREGTFRLTVLPPDVAGAAAAQGRGAAAGPLRQHGRLEDGRRPPRRRPHRRHADRRRPVRRAGLRRPGRDARPTLPAGPGRRRPTGTGSGRSSTWRGSTPAAAPSCSPPLVDGPARCWPATGGGRPRPGAGAGHRRPGRQRGPDPARTVAARCAGVRVHTVGIDQAVNAGFLGRLAGARRRPLRAGRERGPARRGDGPHPPPDRRAGRHRLSPSPPTGST